LILTDISLKGSLSGIEAIKEIKSWSYIPFIYISGLKDESTYQQAMETNPCAFISKPYHYLELKKHIEECIPVSNKINSAKEKSIEM
jgi:DNA-binding NtrC family response regulator